MSNEDRLKEIQALVANTFNIPVEMMHARNRAYRYSRPRQIAMYFCRTKTEATFTEIGAAFNKHHATIVAGVNAIPGLLTLPFYKNMFSKLERELQ